MNLGIKNIAITRSAAGNKELGERLIKMGFVPIAVDTIAFRPPESWDEVDAALRRLATYDWLILTSVNGVRYLMDRIRALGLKFPWKGNPAIAAVGERTAEAIRGFGLQVDFIPSRYLTETLAEELPLRGSAKVLLLRSDLGEGSLTVRLGVRGFSVDQLDIYRTVPVARSRIKGMDRADAILFASASAVRSFCSMVQAGELARLREREAFCIGPVTAKAAKAHGFSRIVMPKVHTLDSLLKRVQEAGSGL